MFTRELTLFAFVTRYVHQLVDDLPPARWAEQPHVGLNHPAWVVGHLVVANDYGLQLLGQPMAGPLAWHALHGPGTQPVADLSRYASAADLLAEFDRTNALLRTAASHANAAQLLPLHTVNVPFLLQSFPSVGDLVTHLLTTHGAGHAGQLSAWRRMLGFPGVLGP